MLLQLRDTETKGGEVCLCVCICVYVDTQSVLENDTEELAPLQQGGAISHISLIHLSVPCARNKRL